MKKLTCIALCAFIILAFVSCTNLESSKKEKETVMQIGGFDVPYEMVQYAVMNAVDDHSASGGKELSAEYLRSDGGKALGDEIMAEAVESLKSVYAVFALGEKYGISRSDGAIEALVDANYEEERKSYGSDKDFKKALEESHMTAAVLRVTLEFDAVYSEMYEVMLDRGDIETDAGKLKEIFASEDFIRVKELLFSAERHSAEECKSLGEKALSEIDSGADFDSYVQEHGESLFMFNNDDGYYICRGIWDKELEDAVFSLDIGEVSEVIVNESGARLFMRAEKSTAYIEDNFDKLKETYTEGAFRRIVEAQLDETAATFCEGYTALTAADIAAEAK